MLAADLAIIAERDRDEAENGDQAYWEGKADEAFGYKPQFLDHQYLQGWFAGTVEVLEEYPRDHTGRIQ